mgnify:CR=1 FL=1|tara:strand:- start:79 stop:183 length:105 start_codon:yes stop_codon:yes gene_type:complete
MQANLNRFNHGRRSRELIVVQVSDGGVEGNSDLY